MSYKVIKLCYRLAHGKDRKDHYNMEAPKKQKKINFPD